MSLLLKSLSYLINGALQTLKITVVAVSLGTVIGLVASLGRLSKKRLLSVLATCHVDFFRGPPFWYRYTSCIMVFLSSSTRPTCFWRNF